MEKTYVLDTNVLVHDPEAILRFEDNDIVLPIAVIEELDGLKRGHGEIPTSVRQALRLLDGLRSQGNLSRGVALPSGGTLRVDTGDDLPQAGRATADNTIIMTAVRLGERSKSPVILVSKDVAVRIKGETLGVAAQDYLNDKTTIFQKCGRILDGEGECESKSVAYRRDGDQILRERGGRESEAIRRRRVVLGISAKNIEQECAIDALLAPEIEVVALTGKAGTGKTLLALAAGIDQVAEMRGPRPPQQERTGYEQVMVARPIVPLGNDIGFLPGEIEQKLDPWMQPVYDNLDVIVATPREQTKGGRGQVRYKSADYLIDAGIVKIEPLTYIRGRSLPRRYLIVDEAQNLRPLDVKTIVTRAGEGTKIVLTGDLEQIDQPYLDATSNGLSYLISRFIEEENFCYLNLEMSARSRLAERAAELL